MLKYILRRLLVLTPTLLAILLITFVISRNTPGDPVYRELDAQFREGSHVTPERKDQEYARVSHARGYDLPTFYVSLTSLAYPDTLHRVLDLSDRANLAEMVSIYGNWESIVSYYRQLKKGLLRIRSHKMPPDQKDSILEAQVTIEQLLKVAKRPEIEYRLQILETLSQSVPLLVDSMQSEFYGIQGSFGAVLETQSTWKNYVPTLHFHGLHNQFHQWLMGVLRLDFGRSYSDGKRPVFTLIKEALPWTMVMGFFSFVLSYMIAIPLGVYGVRKRNQWQDRTVTISLFLLHSIPSFVAAMLVMTFLCNPAYLQLFPTTGLSSDGAELWPLGYRLVDYAHHLTLPILIFSYGGVTFVSRQMRGGMMESIQSDYVRTARAKGLSEHTVVWRHVVRNSILPILTHLAGLFPALVAGGVITESIFSIPGMGLLTIGALGSYDHPVTIGVLTLTASATLFGIFVTDILTAWADPRISFVEA